MMALWTSTTARLLVGNCDACGWTAAFMAMLGFGSFGAPIKSEAAKSVDIDPLVFQSYKSIMCFLTSWLMLALGEPFSFTPLGICSACFWVPSGVAAIYAIKTAGLAVSMGILSSFIVLISFTWGIFVFDEDIHSRIAACFAVFLMMCGLCGMSYYSSYERRFIMEDENPEDYRALEDPHEADNISKESGDSSQRNPGAHNCEGNGTDVSHQEDTTPSDLLGMIMPPTTIVDTDMGITNENIDQPEDILIAGRKFPQRHVGIACAVICGTWGGSIMAPEKLTEGNTSGLGYLISFGIGSAIVTIVLWAIRFGYHWVRLGSARNAYQALPSFHIRVMWLPGCTAGLLWSVGNFFSLISVKYLGEGVGYSVTQSAMLVSGLWGIFYFKEITGYDIITKWFMSALLTISGILLLSYEHREK